MPQGVWRRRPVSRNRQDPDLISVVLDLVPHDTLHPEFEGSLFRCHGMKAECPRPCRLLRQTCGRSSMDFSTLPSGSSVSMPSGPLVCGTIFIFGPRNLTPPRVKRDQPTSPARIALTTSA